MKVIGKLPVKQKSSDFVVVEEGEYEFDEKGHHFLYLLTKKNLTTKELSKKFGFSYAGLKDKISVSVQHVTFDSFKDDYFKGKLNGGFYTFKFIGKVRKKIKVGQLKGNRFYIKVDKERFDFKNYFINYYGVQRLKGNVAKGRSLINSVSEGKKRKLGYYDHFAVDAYLSYLWNNSLSLFLKTVLKGEEVIAENFSFFIPYDSFDFVAQTIPKFWPVLGYKKAVNEDIIEFYNKILYSENMSFELILEVLKRLKIKGDFRKTYLPVKWSFKKEFVEFFLVKGAYATVYLTFGFKDF